MIKLLVTSGCSYSQVPNADISWPVPLSKALNVPAEYHGKGACGNGIISRTIIHAVTNALKKYKADEILVGIMWSGLDRFEVYKKNIDIGITKISGPENYCNPQSVVGDNNYCIINSVWDDELSKIFYKNLYSPEWAGIVNIEHILRTQWFLKNLNIKYFMTGYHSNAFPIFGAKDDSEIKFLMELIDWENWIKEKNMGEWAIKTNLPFRENTNHPSTEMHELYVREHIIPHLVHRNIIDDK